MAPKGAVLVFVALAVLLAAQLKPAAAVDGRYDTSMQEKVRKIVEANRYDAPGLIRMLFHDCWVKGCDASVLLNVTQGKNEIHAPQNGGLRGMGVIQDVKNALVNAGYKNVSCADALIFAAREATVVLSNGAIKYEVDGPGRYDSSTSFFSDAGVLPPPFADFDALLANFQAKAGFGLDDLVLLSGAHAIGRAHRANFNDRLNKTATPSSQIDDDYRNAINRKTSTTPSTLGAMLFGAKGEPDMAATAENNIRDMDDVRSQTKYDATGVKLSPKGVLDNSYYTANLQNMVLFKSDWALRTNPTAAAAMQLYKDKPEIWYGLFGKAMAKLSAIKSDRPEGEFVAGGARSYCDKI